ncbi:heparan-alpha-glucosaminide N-acetyltransferase domain-containing protein [Thalassomonas sp. RHCl1]|uniref:DUF1624 domain-containing protein n=1 Tax=Thalassomonas sp. RHCl1 TaxID=2995320 RepID=UPI00248C019F|nr:heparan-alpha-glucosaminide N-acetyltransferase domain-containing protein [Thalassomonas sp. RHCl1]
MRTNRIESIDILRGVVMLLMALDHVRDYYFRDTFYYDPMDLEQTSLAIFFTRFVTHFCAPVFIFLAGTSAFFMAQRMPLKDLSAWLLKRGIWLVILEVTLVKFGWDFNIHYTETNLQVIWVLGISMILLAGFIHLPHKLGLSLALLMVAGHNLFDGVSPQLGTLWSNIWIFLHHRDVIRFDDMTLVVAYPIVPWAGVMLLGYYFGRIYRQDFSQANRLKLLSQLAAFSIVTFFVLRYFNLYGDARLWQQMATPAMSLMSFFNVSKYPPSLLYLLVTLGPAFLLLAALEKVQGRWTVPLIKIGRVPMFYYLLHLYVIHLGAMLVAVLQGYDASVMVLDHFIGMVTELRGYGVDLASTYLIWIFIVLLMYPLCHCYDNYKRRHPEKAWLSYL